MIIRGPVIKVGDNIDTDIIIPGKYLVYTDPETLGKHAMEPLIPDFHKKAKGAILVAGKNFGMGSSREQAVVALKGAGVKAVVAESFARIFYRNAINQGLPVVEAHGISKEVEDGDEIEIDLEKGVVRIPKKGKELKATKMPPMLLEILKEGGLVPYLKKRVGSASA